MKRRELRSQSAMECLVTYGWAILIISVVLAALSRLGAFSGVMSPRARPGSCQVIRPYGPGSTACINLGGVCSGQLPQYAAQFDGVSSAITVPDSSNLRISSTVTGFGLDKNKCMFIFFRWNLI